MCYSVLDLRVFEGSVFDLWSVLDAEASTAVANNNPAERPRLATLATILRRILCEGRDENIMIPSFWFTDRKSCGCGWTT
jgi:hypothetical protein